MTGRVVMHLDMDAFYASVEQRDRPELRGRAIIVGRRGRRGVVTTCSYEARKFGIRSAMPSITAEKLCTQGIWVRPRFSVYREESNALFALLRERAPIVEQVSIDEAYADLTGICPSPSRARPLGEEIKLLIRRRHDLTASIGLAPNRFVAKIASDMDKPDGLTSVDPVDVPRTISPLPARVIPGVGPKLGARLSRLGVETVGQLARIDESTLEGEFGRRCASWLLERARGEDDRPVEPHSERKQISEERTYSEDLRTRAEIEREILARADAVAHALRRRRLAGRTVTVKVRDASFRTSTRSRTLERPIDLSGEIYPVARELVFGQLGKGVREVRLLGVGVRELVPRAEVPPLLFSDPLRERIEQVTAASDRLCERFGEQILRPARLIERPAGTARDEWRDRGRPAGWLE